MTTPALEFVQAVCHVADRLAVLGAAVATTRKQRELSIRKLADELRINYVTLHRFERGQQVLTTEEAVRLADWLHPDPQA